MAKMLIVPSGNTTKEGEQLVDVFDMQRLNSRGEVYCVSKSVPENMAKVEWKEYEKRPVNRKEGNLS